ncbi:MAG TPA: nitronate monooxygenase, partial [Gaiellaceae bacterium]|nr:nitronate monooxygenase [Gaiellaceae bacterium]
MGLHAALTTALGLEHPIVQAPMAGASTPALAAAVSEAGGLGSLPCALLGPDEIRAGVEEIRSRTSRPFALNFFCHETPTATPAELDRWAELLAPFYEELGVAATGAPPPSRASFDEELCDLALEMRPAVVSFHFGLPEPALLRPLQEAGCAIVSSATTVAEARWLAGRGCDAVIAQGAEAGGHRAMFLADDPAAQIGTIA